MHGHDSLFRALETINSELELAGFLRELTQAFGFESFLIASIPAASEDYIQTHVGLSNRAMCFFKAYDSLGLLRNSPVFAALRRTTVPIVWNIDNVSFDRPTLEVEPARELFDRYNITMGVFFPVHAPDGSRGTIGFDGSRPALTTAELSELGLLVTHAYDIYAGFRNPDRGSRHSLTAREMEVLTWAANGKTSGEIAAILSLSDHTINTYMNTAMRKLDCVNRTQLVAKALRLHLIS